MKTVATALPIELTDDQQDRLIIMASVLFPNREFFFWEVNEDQCVIGLFGHEACTVEDVGKQYVELKMHWLEFLIYKIVPTFIKKHGNLSLNLNMKNLQIENINIVDEFYEKHFKMVYTY